MSTVFPTTYHIRSDIPTPRLNAYYGVQKKQIYANKKHCKTDGNVEVRDLLVCSQQTIIELGCPLVALAKVNRQVCRNSLALLEPPNIGLLFA